MKKNENAVSVKEAVEAMTVTDLRKEAKGLEIAGYSKMKKDDLQPKVIAGLEAKKAEEVKAAKAAARKEVREAKKAEKSAPAKSKKSDKKADKKSDKKADKKSDKKAEKKDSKKGLSNKAKIYKAWDGKNGEKDAKKLSKIAKDEVKVSTIKVWMSRWNNKKGLPSGV